MWLLIFVEVAANMAISAPNDDNNSHLSAGMVLAYHGSAHCQGKKAKKKIIASCHIAAAVAK